MMGISFAGGLSIVAAGRASIRDRVAFVLSLGGHGDLPRTLRYLCTGVEPDGRPPAAARLRRSRSSCSASANRSSPPEQVAPLRTRVLAFLEASRLDGSTRRAHSGTSLARGRWLTRCPSRPAR